MKMLFFLAFSFLNIAGTLAQQYDTAYVNRLNQQAAQLMVEVSDKTLGVSEQALGLATRLKYAKGRATAYVNIAKMHYKIGNYEQSLEAAGAALDISKEENDIVGKAEAYNILGLIFLAQNNVLNALSEFKAAVVVNKHSGHRDRLAANYFNIGLSFLQNNQLDSAEFYFNYTLSISKIAKDDNLMTMAKNRLGDVNYKQGKINEAVKSYQSVIYYKTYQNEWENSFAHTGLAECYFALGKHHMAISSGKKGLLMAQKLAAKWDIERAATVLHQSYYELKDYSNAYSFLSMESRYRDSLLNEAKNQEVNALHLKQQISENEGLVKKNQLVEQQNHNNQLRLSGAAVILVSLIIIVLISYRNSFKVKRLNKKLQELNLNKDQLFSIISHDLRGPINSIVMSLKLFNNGDLDKEETTFFFKRFNQQMAATSMMLNNLLLWASNQSQGNTTTFSNVELVGIMSQIISVFTPIAGEKSIMITHLQDPTAIALADADQVKIILQNLLGNAIKFTPEQGKITIAYLVSGDTVSVSVSDNGLGMSTAKIKQLFAKIGNNRSTYGTNNEKGIGLGLLLVKQFADQNNALIKVKSEENIGTTFTVIFKLNK